MTKYRQLVRPYMVSGPESSEGAVLVFAETSRKAKALAWAKSGVINDIGIDYIDVRVSKLPDTEWLGALKRHDGPEVIDSVPVCSGCEYWHSYLTPDGLCESCADDREFDLVRDLVAGDIIRVRDLARLTTERDDAREKTRRARAADCGVAGRTSRSTCNAAWRGIGAAKPRRKR